MKNDIKHVEYDRGCYKPCFMMVLSNHKCSIMNVGPAGTKASDLRPGALPWGPRSHMWSRSCRATRPLDRSFLQRKLTTSPSPEAGIPRYPQAVHWDGMVLGWYHSIRMEDYWRSTPLVHQAWFIHRSTLIITLTLVEVFETACFQHVSRMVEKRLK